MAMSLSRKIKVSKLELLQTMYYILSYIPLNPSLKTTNLISFPVPSDKHNATLTFSCIEVIVSYVT
jgi:hypothetical protein